MQEVTLAWRALVDDSDRPVVVVDLYGSVLYANEPAARHVGAADPADLVGKKLHDVCESEYADERLTFIREAAQTGEPIAIEGMTRGKFRRTVIRPMAGEDDGHVLMVHVPSRRRERVGGEYPVRRARVDDYGPLKGLTSRELEVLRLIAEGCTTAEVAARLHRSVKTVEWHRVSLGSKLGVTNRVELARIAIQAGLVDVEDALDVSERHPREPRKHTGSNL